MRKALIASAVIGLAIAIGGFELHRHIIAFVWPAIESLWFEYVAF